MENTVELTKSLISLQITENAEADDTALKPMLAGMVQLAHAALNENDEEKKQGLYFTWLTSFELISDQAAEQSAANQLHILQTLQAILLSDELGIEQERMHMIQNTGWDLVRLLAPYLKCSTSSADDTLEIRAKAIELLEVIAKCSNPREVYLTTLQMIKSLQFEGLSEGSDSALGDTVIYIAMTKMLPIIMRRIKTKQLSRFMTSLIKAQNDVLSKLSSLLNKIHSSEMTLDVKEISTSTKVHGIVISKVIIEGVMVFTEYCVETLSYTKIPESLDTDLSTEQSKLHYIVCHHVLNVLQSTIWLLPSDFAKPYFIKRNKKYDIDSARPKPVTDTKQNDDYRGLRENLMMMATSCNLNVDIMLKAVQMMDDASAAKEEDEEARTLEGMSDAEDDDDDEITVTSCSWSLEGIICLIAMTISMYDTKELPVSVDYSTFFNFKPESEQLKYLPKSINRMNLREFANNYCFDKILIVLFAALYSEQKNDTKSLANLQELQAKLDEYSLSKDIGDSDVSYQLFFTFQAISTTATMCSISSYRFLCYQLLTEVLNRFADESSAWMILELLENNPPMRPAAISFVKQKIDDSLKKLKENSDFHSIYLSQLIAKEFYPTIFTYDEDYYLSHEKEFWDTVSLTMQAINFYYYLLIIDKKFNLLNVWSKENIDFVNQNFVSHIQHVLRHYADLYEKKQHALSGTTNNEDKSSHEATVVVHSSDADSEQSMILPAKLVNLSLMQEALDKVLLALEEAKH